MCHCDSGAEAFGLAVMADFLGTRDLFAGGQYCQDLAIERLEWHMYVWFIIHATPCSLFLLLMCT